MKPDPSPNDQASQAVPFIAPAATEPAIASYPSTAEPEDEESRFSEPPKKKQKRNKPTLSCEECVERKTKCDRGRPNCIACLKRQTECKYAHIANILEETNRTATTVQRMTKPPQKNLSISNGSEVSRQVLNPHERSASRGSASPLLSNVPHSNPTASNVFGIGSEHPFANYWTCQGGVPEVIGVLPEKFHADALLERYFECVDPVYPMIHRQSFYKDYENFWLLPQDQKDFADAAFIAMIFSMLALGTQFVTDSPPRGRQQTAEFYVSAAHQSLRLSSYLSNASIRSIQAMVLITYFLVNDNHASDGWAFAGILIRQAYAMGLNRDPNITCPTASEFDKQLRRKLWQAVLLQDTFLTVLLSLPPSATHTDVSVADLTDDSNLAYSHSTDTAYMRGSWTLANLVQETVCSPRSLNLPICGTSREKVKLLADFKAVYRSFPDIFRSWTSSSLTARSITTPRIVRQTLFLTSNYFHNVMLVHCSASPEVPVNPKGALEAAHDAIESFFLLYGLFEAEAKVWWVFNHRAFLEALCIGNILRDQAKVEGGMKIVLEDPLFIRGKEGISEFVLQCSSPDSAGTSDQGALLTNKSAND